MAGREGVLNVRLVDVVNAALTAGRRSFRKRETGRAERSGRRRGAGDVTSPATGFSKRSVVSLLHMGLQSQLNSCNVNQPKYL